MATAVTITFGANSTQFQAELAKMQSLSMIAARRMQATSSAHGMVGLTGVIRESTVIGREIAMGRGLGRILGSMTLLVQYLSSASRASIQAAGSARILADAYAEASLQANLTAIAAMRKAEASAAAAEMDGFENAASVAAADANAAEAASARAAAVALQQKAAAAEVDAVAQETDAAATAGAGLSALGIAAIFGTVALAAGVVYERIWGVKNLLSALSGPEAVDLKDDYIPLLKRHISDAANAQKEVTNEVNKTTAAYNSAANSAKIVADRTKEHFSHLKKMNNLQKETELTSATTPAQKEAIEKKYSDKELQLEKDQQRAELVNFLTEKTNLEIESKSNLAKANNINVATKEEDQKTLSQLNQRAEAAEKFLKGGGVWAEFKKQAAKDLGGASQELINQTEAGGMEAANKMIAQRNQFADKVAQNDQLRKTKADLVETASKSAAEAAKIGLELPNTAKLNAQKNADAEAEAAAKLAAEHAKNIADQKGQSGYGLNAQQRIGAYAATPPVMLQQLEQLRVIARNTSHEPHSTNRPAGARPPSYGGHHRQVGINVY